MSFDALAGHLMVAALIQRRTRFKIDALSTMDLDERVCFFQISARPTGSTARRQYARLRRTFLNHASPSI